MGRGPRLRFLEDVLLGGKMSLEQLALTLIAWAGGGSLVIFLAFGICFIANLSSLFLLGSLVNITLSVVKMGLAQVVAHRKALMADAVHGLGDTVAEVVTALAYHEAARPPDREHPWGHGKIESVGAILVTLILLYVAASMGWDSSSTIYQMVRKRHKIIKASHGDSHQQTSCDSLESVQEDGVTVSGSESRFVRQAAIAVTLSSVVLKEALFFATLQVGEVAQSKLAVATAWHHRSDSLAAGVALASQVGASFGHHYLDPVGGGLVAAMLAHSACGSLQDSLDDLLDYNPASERNDWSRCGREGLSKSIVSVQGIRNHSLRTRRMGPYCLVDVTIKVDARISASAASMLAETVHNRVISDFQPFVTDVLVHVDPDGSPQSHDLETHSESGTLAEVNPDEVESRVRTAILSITEAKPHLPRILEITDLQTYYYAEGLSEDGYDADQIGTVSRGGRTSYIDVKCDLRLDLETTTLRSAQAVAREVRRRVRAELPGLVRDVDVDLELDEGENEDITGTDDASSYVAVGNLGAAGHFDREVAIDGTRVSSPRSGARVLLSSMESQSMKSQYKSSQPYCSSSASGGPRHGNWGSEPCNSGTDEPEVHPGFPRERRLQQITLLWERGLRTGRERVPTMRFGQGMRWTPLREGWLERSRELQEQQEE